mmetsp:Transcript_29787/g.41136  ORF Transcript_29787/g.41136 Transcript_29787/m.41136 type:complete len:290 (-) Transcript_29787:56-925(-)
MTHGFGSALGMFYKNFDDLRDQTRGRVIALDWLGMGHSSRPDFPSSSGPLTALDSAGVDYFLHALEAWRAENNIYKMNLLGHSWGGYLSTLYAARHPERVNHLFLVSPFGVPKLPENFVPDESPTNSWFLSFFKTVWRLQMHPQSVLKMMGPWGNNMMKSTVARRFGDKLHPEEAALVADYLFHSNALPLAGGESLHAFSHLVWSEEHRGVFARAPVSDLLAQTTVPTSLLFGDNDWMWNPQVKDLVEKNSKYLKLHIVEKAGHHVYLDNARDCNHIISSTLIGKQRQM